MTFQTHCGSEMCPQERPTRFACACGCLTCNAADTVDHLAAARAEVTTLKAERINLRTALEHARHELATSRVPCDPAVMAVIDAALGPWEGPPLEPPAALAKPAPQPKEG